MDILGALSGILSDPLSWPIALLVVIMGLILKGLLVPRSQADALSASKDTVIQSKTDQIKDLREDRDKRLAALERERDMWRDAAKESQCIADDTREQNRDLIKCLDGFDHLVNELRSLTTDKGGDKDE